MDSAEKLRKAVVDTARDECLAYTESAGTYLGDRMAWDEDVGVYGPAACVLRAIVEELGVTWDLVIEIKVTPLPCDESGCVLCSAARALSTLLHAAGIPARVGRRRMSTPRDESSGRAEREAVVRYLGKVERCEIGGFHAIGPRGGPPLAYVFGRDDADRILAALASVETEAGEGTVEHRRFAIPHNVEAPSLRGGMK